jgi:hypothetical protein
MPHPKVHSPIPTDAEAVQWPTEPTWTQPHWPHMEAPYYPPYHPEHEYQYPREYQPYKPTHSLKQEHSGFPSVAAYQRTTAQYQASRQTPTEYSQTLTEYSQSSTEYSPLMLLQNAVELVEGPSLKKVKVEVEEFAPNKKPNALERNRIGK